MGRRGLPDIRRSLGAPGATAGAALGPAAGGGGQDAGLPADPAPRGGFWLRLSAPRLSQPERDLPGTQPTNKTPREVRGGRRLLSTVFPFAVRMLSLSFPSPPSPLFFRGWWRALSREEIIWVLKGCVSLFPLTSCFSGCCSHVVRLKGEWRREWLRGGESGEGKRERVTGTAKG